MEIGSIVCSVALAVASLWFGVEKLQLRGRAWTMLRGRGYSPRTVRSIGGGQVTLAALLIGGIFFHPLGIVGCLGTAAVYLWRVGLHVTYGDYGNPDNRPHALVPLGILGFSIVTLVFVVASS